MIMYLNNILIYSQTEEDYYNIYNKELLAIINTFK